jgi:ATP-dependent DNA helicase RecQ
VTPDIHALLQQFGFSGFRRGQEDIVKSALAGEDVVAILPTGGGKSLCYQLPALALDGVTLVISPLISLMKDQVDGMVKKGFPVTFINSALTHAEMTDRIDRMTRGEYKIVYIAPERFKSPGFLNALPPGLIKLFAVDESHCISCWGHDFRPDYLKLRGVLRGLGDPPVMALTATATPEVRRDIIAQLGLGTGKRRPPQVFISGFSRPNLMLAVTNVAGPYEKLDLIESAILKHRTGIVYCSTRNAVDTVAGRLREKDFQIVAYHAGLSGKERTKAQNQFMTGSSDIAVATTAFGMGIDRADLRFVIHHDIPGSIEDYYQQAGRAGRDGKPSLCRLLFDPRDVSVHEFFIEGSNPTPETINTVMKIVRALCREGPMMIPIKLIAAHAKSKNPISVGTALKLLERAHWIRRWKEKGERTYVTAVPDPDLELSDIGIDLESLAYKRRFDFDKLYRMIKYVESGTCRHGHILDYFGEDHGTEPCPACDNCLPADFGGA